jgi:Holliday junction resolvasome RuvABC endonuclease subunit
MAKQVFVVGIDLSLNHFGFVAADLEWKFPFYSFMTDHKTFMSGGFAWYRWLLKSRDRKTAEDIDAYTARRRDVVVEHMQTNIAILTDYLRQVCNVSDGDTYVAFEGYSYGSKSTGLFEIAEVTGCVQNLFYNSGSNLRLYDPLSVKMFATGTARCLKKDMVAEATKLCPDFKDFSKFVTTKKKKTSTGTVEEFDGPITDLADAYFLARMLTYELQLRSGQKELKDLSEQERRVFLRTTKGNPINVLDKPFATKVE